MTNIIKADDGISSGQTGIVSTADTSGTLELQATSGLVTLQNVTGSITIPKGTTAQRPATPTTGMLRYNTNTNLIDLYNGTGWLSVGELPSIPKITNVQVTNSSYTILDDTAVDTSGGYIKITGTGFAASCQVLINNVAATSTTFVSSTEVRAQVPATAAGTYTLYVVNTDGGVAIRVNGITFSVFPSWSTGSTLTEQESNSAISIQLSATSNSNITYQLAQGSSLPDGITLNSSGLLSGTTPTVEDPTVYSFSIVATDQENQDNSRTFSITITATSDQYFRNTVLLLPGNGTNATQNNTFIDSSGNNVSITRQGSSTQGSFSPFSQTMWSNYFNAANSDVFSLGTVFLNSISSSTATFTMEAWVYLSSFGTSATSFYNRTILAKGQIYLNFGIDQNGKVMLYHYDGTARTNASTNAISLNTWTHVAVVVNGSGTITFYIDGVANGTATWYGHSGTNQTARLGGTQDTSGGANNYWNGYISNVRTTSTQVYTSNFTPSIVPLTAISGTTFLSCQSNRFVDNSSNNYTFTIAAGNPSVQAFSPFRPGQEYSTATIGGSGYFAGSGNYLTFPVSTWTALAGVNTSFTVEAWIYRTAVDSQSGDICGTNVAGYTSAVSFTVNTNGALAFADWSGNGSHYTNTVTASGAVPLNAWTHVAASKSGNTMRLFVNGVLLATTTITVANISTLDGSPAIIAGRPAGATMFIGYISSLRIVQGTAVYTANFTPPTGPLSAISGTSLLLNFTNAAIIDSTARNVLQTLGNAQISTTQSKFGGSSLYFDGNGDYCFFPANPLYALNTGDFTIEGWIYFNALASNQTVAGTASTYLSGGWQLIQLASNTLSFLIESNPQKSVTTGTLSTGQWYHIAVTRSGTTLRIFVNGVQANSASSSENITDNAGNKFVVGNTVELGAGRYLNGYIDDLRITKGIARYTGNFTPPGTLPLK